MERQEWDSYKTDLDGYVDAELLKIVQNALYTCNVDKTGIAQIATSRWAKVTGLKNYNFITFGVDDEARISAFPVSYFKNWVWNFWLSPTTATMEDMKHRYKMYWDSNPHDDTRREKGLFIKIGKFLSAMGIDGTDSCLCANIAEQLRMRAKVDTSVIKVTPNVSDIYTMNHQCSGSIGSSCMRNNSKDRFLLYDDIGCKIAYTTDGNYLTGRALIHEEVYIEDKTFKLMDRIYFDNERTKALFCAWAKENGYVRKPSSRL